MQPKLVDANILQKGSAIKKGKLIEFIASAKYHRHLCSWWGDAIALHTTIGIAEHKEAKGSSIIDW